MPVIDVVDCKKEDCIEAFLFALSIYSESSTVGNISVYEDLVIHRMGFDKDDETFAKDLMFWWGDLKTKVQILSMQAYEVDTIRPYDRYQQIFPGLAL